MTTPQNTTTPRKPYRRPDAPKKVGSVDTSANGYSGSGADFGSYSSGPNPG